MTMNISNAGVIRLRELESSERFVYKDSAGLPTIGVGHLLKKDEIRSGKVNILGEQVHYRNGLTQDQVDALLGQDLVPREMAVNKFVRVPLAQNQFDALVLFVFNIGRGAFQASTLLKRLNAGKYMDVPDQMRRWVYSAGSKIDGLVNRREAEIVVWENPLFGKDTNQQAIPLPEKKPIRKGQTLEWLVRENGLKINGLDRDDKKITICYDSGSQQFEVKES